MQCKLVSGDIYDIINSVYFAKYSDMTALTALQKQKILATANGTPHTPSITLLSGFRIYKILRGLTLTLWLISLRFAPNFFSRSYGITLKLLRRLILELLHSQTSVYACLHGGMTTIPNQPFTAELLCLYDLYDTMAGHTF